MAKIVEKIGQKRGAEKQRNFTNRRESSTKVIDALD